MNKDKINCIPYKSFNPSMVLTFLISNNKELDKFKDTFKTMSNMSSYFFCDETENMTPSQLEVRMSSSAPSLKFMEEHQGYAGNDEGATPWDSEFMTI